MSDETPGCIDCGRDNDNGTHSALEAVGHLNHTYTPWKPAALDAEHIARQRAWSKHTFGPGRRLLGVTDHIRKELQEVIDSGGDLSEWVDVIILALDGAWRSGAEPQAIIDAVAAKQARNEARTWPDWRQASEDTAIEHVRTVGVET